MNYFNVYVQNSNDIYTMSKVSEDNLKKITDAYDLGKESVFIEGEKRILKGLIKIKVFSFEDSWDNWNAFVNSDDTRIHHMFSRLTGKIAIGIPALASKGKDLTKIYFNNDFGWRKKEESDSIFMVKKYYINHERITQLKELKNSEYDFQKLVRICEEINICYNLDCFYAVGNLLRSLIDHIPPIFGFTNFREVTNNYSGTKSFKDTMQPLENSLRKISDSFLHTLIRKKEVLPTINQVEFIASIDVLLAEIIRITDSKD